MAEPHRIHGNTVPSEAASEPTSPAPATTERTPSSTPTKPCTPTSVPATNQRQPRLVDLTGEGLPVVGSASQANLTDTKEFSSSGLCDG